MVTSVLEEHASSIFKEEVGGSRFLKTLVPIKKSTWLAFQKTIILTAAIVRTL
jgi:hypothetical protein